MLEISRECFHQLVVNIGGQKVRWLVKEIHISYAEVLQILLLSQVVASSRLSTLINKKNWHEHDFYLFYLYILRLI